MRCSRSISSAAGLSSVLPPAVHEGDDVAEAARESALGVHTASYNAYDLLISCITTPMRSSFFRSDLSSRSLVFGCISFVCIAIAPSPNGGRDGDRVLAGLWWRRRQQRRRRRRRRRPWRQGVLARGLGTGLVCLRRVSRFPDFPISRFPSARQASPLPRPRHRRAHACRAAPCTRPRACKSTLITHVARVRASPATHVLSHCNTRVHVKSKDGVLLSLAIG